MAFDYDEAQFVEGSVYDIIYYNEENSYTVCEIEQGEDVLVMVGYMPGICAGEHIKAYGEYVNNAKYGRQFRVATFEKKLPVTTNAIFKYLASGAVKGIGPKTANNIVEMFGENTFDIIENSPMELANIKGISKNKAMEMSQSYKEQFGIRNVLVFLQQYDISPLLAAKIWKRWGMYSIDLLKENPYLLCQDIEGIGFNKADAVAAAMGFDKNSQFRICAGIEYVISYNCSSNGHTYIPYNKLLEVSSEMLEVNFDAIKACIIMLQEKKRIIVEDIDDNKTGCVFLWGMYSNEKYIAKRIKQLSEFEKDNSEYDEHISQLETKNSIKYATKQKEAIVGAMQHQIMILTGGPGTGKTTVLQGIISLLEKNKQNIVLCAPTGRAAKRMSELTGREAKTVHRLLGMQYTDGGIQFTKNEDDMLDCDVVICDEVSMFDVYLMASLLKACSYNTKFILVGDIDQLPSVGAGNVFKDIIESGTVFTIRLDEVFRQAAKSLIVTNAHSIIKGQMPNLNEKNKDFFFLERKNDQDVIKTVVELCTKRLPDTYGFSPLNDIQVMSPSKKGESGTVNLNIALKNEINPKAENKREKKLMEAVFREGDKVMQTKNNYHVYWVKDNGEDGEGVYNGDIGILEQIDYSCEKAYVRFDNRVATYQFADMSELESAYAITVHKSQGSEFGVVVLVISSGAPMLFHRNLLYTAVTRAKDMLIIVGNRDKIKYMVDNVKQVARYSALKSMIIGEKDD